MKALLYDLFAWLVGCVVFACWLQVSASRQARLMHVMERSPIWIPPRDVIWLDECSPFKGKKRRGGGSNGHPNVFSRQHRFPRHRE